MKKQVNPAVALLIILAAVGGALAVMFMLADKKGKPLPTSMGAAMASGGQGGRPAGMGGGAPGGVGKGGSGKGAPKGRPGPPDMSGTANRTGSTDPAKPERSEKP